MDEQELIRILTAGARKPFQRRWNCPTDSIVASYLEQRLGSKEKARFEAHLADCDFCLCVVGEISRQQATTSDQPEIPSRLLRQAIDTLPLKANGRASWKWLVAPVLASVAVASFVFLSTPQP